MKTIFLITSILACVSLAGQTNYYTINKTFVENGYTYQCEVAPWGIVALYNTSNRLIHTEQVYKSTGKAYAPSDGEWVPLTEDDNWTWEKRKSIVDNIFSASEKERVKGRSLSINLYIDSQTGKVVEVDFEFSKNGAFATIPVSVYRKIETELIKQIWYTPSVEGKKLNFIRRNWVYEIESTGSGSSSNSDSSKSSGTKLTPVEELPSKEKPSLPVK